MTLASFPMTSISSKAHKIDFSYFLFTVDATFLYYVQSRNLAEKNLNSRRAGRAGTRYPDSITYNFDTSNYVKYFCLKSTLPIEEYY